MATANRLAGSRWNRIEDRIAKAAAERMDWIEEQLLADGYPPFYQPMTPRDQYEALIAMRNSNHPDYWNDPAAQKKLVELAKRYGPPPAPAAAIPAYPISSPLAPFPAAGP